MIGINYTREKPFAEGKSTLKNKNKKKLEEGGGRGGECDMVSRD